MMMMMMWCLLCLWWEEYWGTIFLQWATVTSMGNWKWEHIPQPQPPQIGGHEEVRTTASGWWYELHISLATRSRQRLASFCMLFWDSLANWLEMRTQEAVQTNKVAPSENYAGTIWNSKLGVFVSVCFPFSKGACLASSRYWREPSQAQIPKPP